MNMLAHFDSPLVLARHLTSVTSLVTKIHKICTQIGFFFSSDRVNNDEQSTIRVN